MRGIKEIRESYNREISKEKIKELMDIEELLIELKQLCETPKDDEVAAVVAKFHDIETRIFDMKREAIVGKST